MSSKKPDVYGGGKYEPPAKELPSTEPPSKGGDHSDYERLRIILDSLQIGALRYYLNDTDAAEKAKRFEKLSSTLLPVCREFWGGAESIALAGGCPPGYNDCDGVCVPYSC
jgi:hypothetical protein